MFDHIGGKIKTVAKAVCWIGIVLSIVFGLILLIALSTDSLAIGIAVAIPVAIPVTVLGAFLSWIGSFTLYGYGELIELTAKIERNTKHS